MESHYYKGAGTGYPVGANMKDAIRIAKSSALLFKKLDKYSKDRPINLWCRGSSGAILASLFASNMKREVSVCHVKKEGERSHISTPPTSSNGINIIIDDFISTGDTMKSIYQSMTRYGFFEVDCLVICGQCGSSEEWIKDQISFIPSHLITNN